jgi:hypothetical protein
MLTDVGYRLIEVASGAVLNQWGGVVGEMPAIPSRIDVPGKQIHCPAVGVEYDGYRLDLWQIEAESTLRCSASQFRRAALQIGLLDAIEAAAASMPRDWQIKWEYAPEYRRADPDWDAAAAALGKTPADVDALFALAVTL